MNKDYLSINDLSKEELLEILDQAAKLKQESKDGVDQTTYLKGKSLGLIFEKPSLRTRISFEVGMKQLGGTVVVLSGSEVQMNGREELSDVSKVLATYLDAVMVRTFGQDLLEQLAEASSISVINGLTDLEHPCQILADLMTIKEEFGSLEGLKIAYVGDGNNVARSLMLACTKLGIQFQLACPVGFEPGKEYESAFATVSHGVGEAAQGADVLYTDVWASMGQEKEAVKRRQAFTGYQINTSLLEEFAKDSAIVLHCLPAHRGEEITGKVFDLHEKTIIRQAENRLHAQKAVLMKLLAR